MKIFYDNQIFILQKFGGISRYFCELIKHSKNLFNYSVGGIFSDNIYAHELGFHKSYPIKEDFEGKWNIQKQINLEDITTKLKNDSYSIYHPTYYNPYFIDKIDKPVVLTVYDMIHELRPGNSPVDNNVIAQKKTMILNAAKIIGISLNTKKDILKFYPQIPEEKISVVHLGTSFDSTENSIFKNKSKERKNYILFTGERNFYKNFTNFILAVAPVLKKHSLQLKCTGKLFTDSEIDLLKQQNIFEITSVQFANEDELKELYAKALCFVFPSLYEGFGIPILEAFACGCPLVLSNASCFPEIAGDAGVYFDPCSIEDMREKIGSIICSETLQKDLAIKGFERLKAFSWKKCTEETAEVYRSI